MKRLLLFLYMVLACVGIQAQEEEQGEQLLVFRNTGVVDLLYSNEVDSILTTDSTQVFYAKDTTLVVPFAELDSVAVGSRNEIKFHADVKELTNETDMPWIIRFDGQSIYYQNNTPVAILPVIGQKLFRGFDHSNVTENIFPYGLTARVTAVTKGINEIRVDIEEIELDEIFSHLFYAGPMHSEREISASRPRVPHEQDIDEVLERNIPIEIGKIGSVNIKGKVKVSGKVVTDIGWGKKYYHADLNIDYGFGFDVKLHSDVSSEESYDDFRDDIKDDKLLGSIYKVIDIYGALGSYVDVKAKLGFELSMERTYHRKLLWTRNDKTDDFQFIEANPNEPFEDKAKMDLTLNGKLSLGPALRVDFAIVGIRLGARAKLKIGPEFEGNIDVTMLNNLRNYNPELYASAQLSISGRAKIEAYTINRHYLIFGVVDEHKFWEHPFTFAKRTWNLFPNYQKTAAVAMTTKTKEVKTEVATAVPDPTPTDLEMGFETVDPQGEIVDSTFVGTVKAEPEDTTVAQTFVAEMSMPSTIKQENLEGYTMRPIFHYAGYTISAAPVGISKDVLLQPCSSTQSNGAMTFISSGPFIGSAVNDSTLYQVGAYLPVPLKKNVYGSIPYSTSEPINDVRAEMLIGTWQGTVDEELVTLVFEKGGTGKYNDLPFVYELNTPQSGSLLMTFEDGETQVYRVLAINESELSIKNKRKKDQPAVVMKKV